jgi:hypothetical protein
MRAAHSPGVLESSVDGCTTLYENFVLGMREAGGSGPCVGERPLLPDGTRGQRFTWLSYAAVSEIAMAVGSALTARGHARQSAVGLYSRNVPEWVLIEQVNPGAIASMWGGGGKCWVHPPCARTRVQGCNAFSLVTVPLYDTLGPSVVEYVVNQTDMATVACTRDKVASVLEVAPRCPSLRLIVVMDGSAAASPTAVDGAAATAGGSGYAGGGGAAAGGGPAVISLQQLVSRGGGGEVGRALCGAGRPRCGSGVCGCAVCRRQAVCARWGSRARFDAGAVAVDGV